MGVPSGVALMFLFSGKGHALTARPKAARLFSCAAFSRQGDGVTEGRRAGLPVPAILESV